jgi:hypothetical protein
VDVALLERAAEVVFFTPYALPGLAFPLSSFLLVLEAYWHICRHIFVCLCEMFVCICPSLMLFR